MDTLKTLTVGISGITVTWMDWIPWTIRLCVAVASLIYMIYKALNEKRKYEGLK